MIPQPPFSALHALGPVPKDLGGFQQLVGEVTIQLGDVYVSHGKPAFWAFASVGMTVSRSEELHGRAYRLYRRMPVASHVPDAATQKVIDEAKTALGETPVPHKTPLGWGPVPGEFLPKPAPKTFIPTDRARRKGAPMFRGLLAYFPAALFAVAEHSRKSNDEHNPGEELHWSRDKSNDHSDCIPRHLIDAGEPGSPDREYHLAALAWRSLALLQEELERNGAAPGVGSKFSQK